MKGWRCGDIYICTHTHKEILVRYKKIMKFVICSNMDIFGGHYAKWNKSDRDREILYDITYMWNLKNKLVSIEQKQTHRCGEHSY